MCKKGKVVKRNGNENIKKRGWYERVSEKGRKSKRLRRNEKQIDREKRTWGGE